VITETAVSDRTPLREILRADLSAAVTKATRCGLGRVQVIADMLTFCDELCANAVEAGDDMTPLAGLLE
jgi:hypothetical protein